LPIAKPGGVDQAIRRDRQLAPGRRVPAPVGGAGMTETLPAAFSGIVPPSPGLAGSNAGRTSAPQRCSEWRCFREQAACPSPPDPSLHPSAERHASRHHRPLARHRPHRGRRAEALRVPGPGAAPRRSPRLRPGVRQPAAGPERPAAARAHRARQDGPDQGRAPATERRGAGLSRGGARSQRAAVRRDGAAAALGPCSPGRTEPHRRRDAGCGDRTAVHAARCAARTAHVADAARPARRTRSAAASRPVRQGLARRGHGVGWMAGGDRDLRGGAPAGRRAPARRGRGGGRLPARRRRGHGARLGRRPAGGGPDPGDATGADDARARVPGPARGRPARRGHRDDVARSDTGAGVERPRLRVRSGRGGARAVPADRPLTPRAAPERHRARTAVSRGADAARGLALAARRRARRAGRAHRALAHAVADRTDGSQVPTGKGRSGRSGRPTTRSTTSRESPTTRRRCPSG
jgi:hypothetical protein